MFTRDEVEALISDARVPLHRRVLYALLLLTGMRIGEVAGRRWRDYDTKTRPLGKLSVDTQYDDEALKTETPRQVPVHATLAAILDEWRRHGFVVLHGHHPQADEFIVPKLRGEGPQDKRRVWHNLQTDLELLGLRPRRVHDTRRSFITLALHDGARERYLKKVTHDGKGESAFDDYDAADWADLCTAVGCLQVERRSVAAVVTLRAAAGA